MFAPLIRDGRMDKFYWKPSRAELVGILHQMYLEDGLSPADMEALLDRFPAQPLDFFGALRASTYDGQIRAWITGDVLGGAAISDGAANMRELGRRLLGREGLPTFEPVTLTLDMLIKARLRRGAGRGGGACCGCGRGGGPRGRHADARTHRPTPPIQRAQEGERLEMEQEMVNRNKLSKEYLKPSRKGRSLLGFSG
jgi:hypothetical protein